MEGKLKVFRSRDEIEIKILTDQGKVVQLEGSIDGEREVRVPRWSVRKAYTCGESIAMIIAKLFPKNLPFLLSVDMTSTATAAAEIYKILYQEAYQEMMKVIAVTLDISEQPVLDLLCDSITPADAMEIFTVIVEQEINNDTVQAILKKTQRLLVERFHLGKESLDIRGLLELLCGTSLTDSQLTSLLSLPTTPISN